MRETARMRTSHLKLTVIGLLAVALVVVGCSSPEAAATPAAPTVAVDAAHLIELELTSDLKIKQDGQQVSTIPVKRGETYTFRVTNTAGFDHDFHIGTDAELSSGGHAHAGIQPWNEGMREFQYTFDSSGPLAFGCTIPGHYALMKGFFDIQP